MGRARLRSPLRSSRVCRSRARRVRRQPGAAATAAAARPGGAGVVPASAPRLRRGQHRLRLGDQWRQLDALLDKFPDREQAARELQQALSEQGVDLEHDVKAALGPGDASRRSVTATTQPSASPSRPTRRSSTRSSRSSTTAAGATRSARDRRLAVVGRRAPRSTRAEGRRRHVARRHGRAEGRDRRAPGRRARAGSSSTGRASRTRSRPRAAPRPRGASSVRVAGVGRRRADGAPTTASSCRRRRGRRPARRPSRRRCARRDPAPARSRYVAFAASARSSTAARTIRSFGRRSAAPALGVTLEQLARSRRRGSALRPARHAAPRGHARPRRRTTRRTRSPTLDRLAPRRPRLAPARRSDATRRRRRRRRS